MWVVKGAQGTSILKIIYHYCPTYHMKRRKWFTDSHRFARHNKTKCGECGATSPKWVKDKVNLLWNFYT